LIPTNDYHHKYEHLIIGCCDPKFYQFDNTVAHCSLIYRAFSVACHVLVEAWEASRQLWFVIPHDHHMPFYHQPQYTSYTPDLHDLDLTL